MLKSKERSISRLQVGDLGTCMDEGGIYPLNSDYITEHLLKQKNNNNNSVKDSVIHRTYLKKTLLEEKLPYSSLAGF